MNWDGFGPLILPYATTCPCRCWSSMLGWLQSSSWLTKAWQADLSPLAANGVLTSFAMAPPTDAKVEKLISVSITDAYGNVTEANLKTEGDRSRLARRSTDVMASTQDRATLRLTPAQPVGSSIVIRVALKPTQAAASLPDEVFEQYGHQIAKGALATLLAIGTSPGPTRHWRASSSSNSTTPKP